MADLYDVVTMVKNSRAVFQHYRSEEHDLIDKYLSLIAQVELTYSIYITEFLNPRQVEILVNLVNQSDLKTYISSEYYDTEYAKVIIAPDYYELNCDDFEIRLIELTYNSKFNHLTHRQILGTIINQLGIKRSVFGDILLAEGKVHILVDATMISYFINHITKIGKIPVSIKEIPLKSILPRLINKVNQDILVASWRADVILSEILRLSRNNALKLFDKDKIKLNYVGLEKASTELKVGDLLSIRGYGRYYIAQDNGRSKSGKVKLTIEKITEL